MENNLWIRIEFNDYNLLQGKDELLNELREVCTVQSRNKWYPAACTGLEFLVDINFNLTLQEFVNNVIIPGFEYWVVGKAFSKIWSAFKAFLEKNKEYDIQSLKLYFNDVVITFRGSPSYGTMMKVYQSLPRHLDILQENGITEISEIRFPYCEVVDEETGEKTYKESFWDNTDDDLLWKVRYMLGCESCYYNPNTEKVI